MNESDIITWSVCFAIGAAVGGLLTAFGILLPRRMPIVTPIRRYVYPIMMALSGICFVLLYESADRFSELAAGCFLVSILVALTASDLKYRLLPNKIVYPAIAAFAVWRLLFHPLPIWHYALGFLIGGGLLYLVSYAAVKLNRPAMGGGDIKLMALLGLAMGAELIVFTLLLSSAIGVVAGLIMIATRRISSKDFIPFGPFIALGGITAWLYGESVMQWYYGFLTY